MSGTKYLIYDLENMAALGWVWGIWQQDVIRVEHPQHLMTIAYKWLGCDSGDMKCWKTMCAYNKQDVILTEKLYLELRPYDDTPPKMGVMDGRPAACDVCGSERMHNKTKKAYAGGGWRMQYKCYDCGHHQLGSKLHKDGKPLA